MIGVMMTKAEARALVAMQDKVNRAVEACLAKLSNREREWAESYWAAHIRASVGGTAYGSAPTGAARELLGL